MTLSALLMKTPVVSSKSLPALLSVRLFAAPTSIVVAPPTVRATLPAIEMEAPVPRVASPPTGSVTAPPPLIMLAPSSTTRFPTSVNVFPFMSRIAPVCSVRLAKVVALPPGQGRLRIGSFPTFGITTSSFSTGRVKIGFQFWLSVQLVLLAPVQVMDRAWTAVSTNRRDERSAIDGLSNLLSELFINLP